MVNKIFLEELAELLISSIESSQYDKVKHGMVTEGHLNYRVFNPRKLFRQNAESFIAFLCLAAMFMYKMEFRKMGYALIDYISDRVEDSKSNDIIHFDKKPIL